MLLSSILTSVAQALGIAKGGNKGHSFEINRQITRMNDPNPQVRRSACWSLGKMDPPPEEVLSELNRLAKNDPESFVAKSAKWAIKRIEQG
jgi:hypothetical protein